MRPGTRNSKPETARLRVTEIFYSLQGESLTAGLPTAFIRLTGCPLRCGYCDTSYAFRGGKWMVLSAILARVAEYNPRYVTVTGGEPLAQPACLGLLTELCNVGYRVSLETSGALDISAVDARVIKVMDLKTPGSGESRHNLYSNIAFLGERDQVKFVLCDRQDYDWAKETLIKCDLPSRCEVLFSPAHGRIEARALADWILDDHLPVRLQIQLHKYLWGEERGR